jgi:predicted transcriptional regulator
MSILKRFHLEWFAYYVVLCKIMDKQTVSFRLESEKVAALDALAETMDRDRTYLLGEAVQAYLETQRWHLEEIEAGLVEAEAGHVIDHHKVKGLAAKWRRKK